MANYDNTTLWSDDPAKFDEITRNICFGQQGDNIEREPGKLHTFTAWGVPYQEIKELSAQHPDMTFYAKHSFESDRWETIRTVEYKAGEAREINVEPAYTFHTHTSCGKDIPCYSELEAKIITIFKRVDRVADDPDGGKKIDWCEAEMTVVVEHDEYRMQAKKIGVDVVDIKFFKAHETKNIEWREVCAELPF